MYEQVYRNKDLYWSTLINIIRYEVVVLVLGRYLSNWLMVLGWYLSNWLMDMKYGLHTCVSVSDNIITSSVLYIIHALHDSYGSYHKGSSPWTLKTSQFAIKHLWQIGMGLISFTLGHIILIKNFESTISKYLYKLYKWNYMPLFI